MTTVAMNPPVLPVRPRHEIAFNRGLHQLLGRLSGLNRPKIPYGPTRRKRQKTSGKSTKGEGTKKGRNFGKLAQLMNMPLDVFFEVPRLPVLLSKQYLLYIP